MIEIITLTGLTLLGLVLGSFVGASVWRLRAYQLKADKKAGEKVDNAEWKRLKPLTEKNMRDDRSQCLHCGYQLQWFDLIPLVSWLSLKGKCRNCRQPIGKFELLTEVGVAVFFVASYVFWPFPITDILSGALFATWLLAGVGLAILFAYDAKWYLLPDKVNFVVAGLGLVSVILTMVISGDALGPLYGATLAVAIMSGLYLVLYLVSRGAWIGFGDVKLGVGLGLLLGDWQLAILALFLANVIGCLIVLPLMAAGKVSRTTQVPFGPLLIAGTVIAKLCGAAIISWYLGLLS
jgi:leader peptidase (prepilin peptidase)/N-methyltransferase